jgi:ATP-dependent DNA helicase Rep
VTSLNPAQIAAVRHVDGPLLVIAGAGSGKTRVITAKIAHLVRECGMPARRIHAVTFTNKAAREMRERAASALRGMDAKGLSVTTFHTLGLAILRSEHARVGLRPRFSILDADDSRTMLGEVLRKSPQAAELAALQSSISAWKALGVGPADAAAAAADDAGLAAARAYADYQRALLACNAVDFDDLIALPVQALTADSGCCAAWQERVGYLLVDEYQDTNAAQYRLLRALTGERARFTAVGDDDQSIYAWRGAAPQNLALLREDYPHLEVVALEQNYRSTGSILKAANALIANNPHVFQKKLWSAMGPGEDLRVIEASDEEGEAERVVADLLHRRLVQGHGFEDFAILYRGNHQSRPLEKRLREAEVPYHLSGGTSFFAHSEVRDVFAYLRLIANPDDDAAFLRIVNVPRREIGAATLEKLSAQATRAGLSLLATAALPGIRLHVGDRAWRQLAIFVDWLQGLARCADSEDASRVVRRVVEEADYRAWIEEQSPDTRTARRRNENLDELLTFIDRSVQRNPDAADLASVVNRLTLMDRLDRGEEEVSGRVRLMTLHAAKGLEFAHVYLVGMEEDILPHKHSQSPQALEEERRLAYVGITRAQRTLTFSLARSRRSAGERVASEPSRFLSEIPEELLDWEGRRPKDGQERVRGKAALASLRNLLGDS